VARALRALGYGVWRDDELPAHRAYAEVIEERLRAARAVVVMWSAEAVKSQWVRAEADVARERGTLVQLSLDGARPPLPFNQIQCADLRGWQDDNHPGWRKVASSIAELLGRKADLATAPRGAAMLPPERVRIGVALRPVVMAAGADAEGLSPALSDEIATAMVRSPTLHVLTPHTAYGAEDTADFVVEGSLQRSGARLRLSMRLTLGLDGSLLWSERYDGSLDDLFDFQDRVASAITISVENALREREVEKAAGVAPDSMNARQLYFRAIALLRGLDRTSLRDAIDCVERLIAMEPGHMHALAIGAMIYFNAWHLGFGDGDPDALRAQAADCALRALRLSDTDPWSCGMSALVLAWVGHPVEVSVTEMDRVLAIAPSFTIAWFWSGLLRIRTGDLEKAAAHLEHLFEIDPRPPVRPPGLCYLAVTRILQRRFDEALPLLVESSRLRPDYVAARIFAAICLGHLGRPKDAARELAAARAIAPVENFRWPTRDAAHRDLLREGLARAGLADSEEMFADL
jgi:TolB-like protein